MEYVKSNANWKTSESYNEVVAVIIYCNSAFVLIINYTLQYNGNTIVLHFI